MPSDQSCEPFFIVGSGRSGTTLLRLILTAHSEIAIPPETWFLLDLVDKFPPLSQLTPEQARVAVQIITQCHRWSDLGMSKADFAQRALALNGPTLAELINIVFQFQAERTGKSRIGDKTPPYIGIVPQIRSIYPNAKFIHLIRDGRDVAISFVEAHFKGRSYHGAKFEWVKAIRCGISYRSLPFSDDIFEVRYEELVGYPEQTVRRICEFLGVQFEPSMMTFDTSLKLIPKREQSIHRKLSKPIIHEAIEVWRLKLSPFECFIMEASLRNDLAALGYPLLFSKWWWRPPLWLASQLTRILAPLLDRAIPALRRRGLITRAVYI